MSQQVLQALEPAALELSLETASHLEQEVSWAVEALAKPAVGIARLGGYLEHRSKTPIGIQVLWRGWLKLHDLCVRVASRREGWQLAKET